MRPARLLALLLSIAVLAFAAAGCGGGGGSSASGTKPETWSATVCGALQTWTDDLKSGSQNLSADLGKSSDLKSVKQKLVAFLENAEQSTQKMVQDVKAAGAPAVKDGPAIQSDLENGLTERAEQLPACGRQGEEAPDERPGGPDDGPHVARDADPERADLDGSALLQPGEQVRRRRPEQGDGRRAGLQAVRLVQRLRRPVSACSRAARSNGAPCVASMCSTGRSSNGRSPAATCSRVRSSLSQRGLISSPLPKSTSVSPAMTAPWLSTQSTVSFGFCPEMPRHRRPAARPRVRMRLADPFFGARHVGGRRPPARGEAPLAHQVLGGVGQRV